MNLCLIKRHLKTFTTKQIIDLRTGKEIYKKLLPKADILTCIKKNKKHMVTTGYNFEGYFIKKYITVVQSEVVLGTGFLSEFSASVSDVFGMASATMEGKLSEAKYRAQRQLIKRSIKTGGNALIGISISITTLRNNMLVISAMGTSVMADKIV